MEDQQHAVTIPPKAKVEQRLTNSQYSKLADWGERVALVMLGSLVVEQIVNGAPVMSVSVVVGAFVTALAYGAAYHWLRQAKE